MQSAPQLWTSLRKQTQLESLAIDLNIVAGDDVYEALLAAVRVAFASLCSLRELSIVHAWPLLSQAVRQLVDSACGVQRLQMSCVLRPTSPVVTEAQWRDLCNCMGHLPLQHLHLTIDPRQSQEASRGIYVAALQPLTQLTALHIDSCRSYVGGAFDRDTLAGMQQLQSLCIRMYSVPPALRADCVRGLGALPALTELALDPDYVYHDGFEDVFVQSAPGAAWAALKWLGLLPDGPAQIEGIARAVAAFPEVKELMLGTRLYNPVLHDRESGEDRCCLEFVHAHRIAADAGFEIEIKWDWTRFDWKSAWA